MRPFQFVEARSITEAARWLDADSSQHRLIAGGTDLLGEVKEGVVRPTALVSIATLLELRGVAATSEGLRLGALTTLAELERNPDIAQGYPALAQAVASVATPQIRNVGTLGGNLCQRPRCWYYRSAAFDCRKKGGAVCYAASDYNKYHAIFGGRDCYIVHPSDVAVALVSLQAEVAIAGTKGARRLPIEDFFVGPERNILSETVLQPGEILTHVSLPRPSPGSRGVYLKVRERQTEDFALASVALVVDVSDGLVRDARITLGGVAPIPWRARDAEDALRGAHVERVEPEAIGELAVQGARPLRDNGFKVALTSSLVGRAVRTLLKDGRLLPK
jgi:xanthine dehydrogenase YagS FAD-binding subunit